MAPAQYEFVVKGRLGAALVHWFDDLEMRSSGPDATYLCGWVEDQSALQGILLRLGDLGLEISSVRQLPEPE